MRAGCPARVAVCQGHSTLLSVALLYSSCSTPVPAFMLCWSCHGPPGLPSPCPPAGAAMAPQACPAPVPLLELPGPWFTAGSPNPKPRSKPKLKPKPTPTQVEEEEEPGALSSIFSALSAESETVRVRVRVRLSNWCDSAMRNTIKRQVMGIVLMGMVLAPKLCCAATFATCAWHVPPTRLLSTSHAHHSPKANGKILR